MKFFRDIRNILTLIFVFILQSCSDKVGGQNLNKSKLFGDTKFEVLKKSTSLNDKSNTNLSALYLKVNLSQSVKDSFYKLSSEDIWQFLNDSTTSWTTNILLYEKYEKDAYLFFVKIHRKKDWLPMRNEDLKYWRNKLRIQ